MKKMRSILTRYRLMLNVLALVFVLGTLAAPAAADDGMVIESGDCAYGCINWNQQSGCVECQRCCTGGGGYFCYQVANGFCP
jgi:hypothetical protein